MTEEATQPATPQKSSLMKKILWAVGIIFALLGIDHYTLNWVSGGVEVTVTDSTIVVAPMIDMTPVVAPSEPVDTVSKDTVK